MRRAPRHPRRRHLQSHVLLHRQGRAARLVVRVPDALRRAAEQDAQDRQPQDHVVLRADAARHADSRAAGGPDRLIVAQVTVTPERQKLVDFTNPDPDATSTKSSSPDRARRRSPRSTTCPGKNVFVRKTSSYYDEPAALNAGSRRRGKPPVDIQEASEKPRRRRPARDGERRAHPGHRRRRLPGGLLEEGLHGADRARHGHAADRRRRWRSRFARTARSSPPG